LTRLARDFLFEVAHLIAARVIAILHQADGVSMCSFGYLVSLLPLLGILSGPIDFLVRTAFDGANVRLLALSLSP
jgi:hypothetical protein